MARRNGKLIEPGQDTGLPPSCFIRERFFETVSTRDWDDPPKGTRRLPSAPKPRRPQRPDVRKRAAGDVDDTGEGPQS